MDKGELTREWGNRVATANRLLGKMGLIFALNLGKAKALRALAKETTDGQE